MDGVSVGIQQFPGFIISQNKTKSPPQKSGELKGNSVHHLTSPANPAEILPKFTPTEVIPYHSQYIPNLCDNSRWIKWLTTIPESDEGNRFRQQPFSWKQKQRIQIPLPSIQLTLTLALLNTGLEDTSFQQKAQGLS